MNLNNVVSQIVGEDLAGKEDYLVKLTSTGIKVAASGDRIIGTLRRGNIKKDDGSSPIGLACDVLLARSHWVSQAVLGNTSAAIALGAGLIADTDSGNPGKLIPSESSPIAIAWQAATGSDGAHINVLFLT